MRDKTLFTVFFEDPFWVGIFERTDSSGYSAARVVFGQEPSDAQVLEFMAKRYPAQVFFSRADPSVPIIPASKINPKRLQRNASKLVQTKGVGSKAKDALKKEYEEAKASHQKIRREKKLVLEEEKYQKRLEKKKEKKRGH